MQTAKMTKEKRKMNVWIKAARIAAKTILFTILFFLIVILFLHFPFVQKILRQKAVAYLEKKLETKVSVGGVYIELPKNIRLENVYVEDRNKDTLLSGGDVKVNLDLWKLVRHQTLDIKSIGLKDITAKFSRLQPGDFNYQFVIDAFVPRDTTVTSIKDTGSVAISLGDITLDKINLTYIDAVTGDNIVASVNHLDSRIDVFDAAQMNFDIPNTTVDGLWMNIRQVKPLATPEPFIIDSLEAMVPIDLKLAFEKANLKDVHLNYDNQVAGLSTNADIGILEVEPDNIDLINKKISLDKLLLTNSTIRIRLIKKEQAKILAKQVVQEAKSLLNVGWTISATSLELDNNAVQFNDDNSMRLRTGIDYAHLDATKFNLKARDVFINDDTARGKIAEASFSEQSGIVLEQLTTSFLYTNKEVSLDELYIKTPGTELKRKVVIRYAAPGVLTDDIGNAELDIDLQDSKLLVKDLLAFAPQLKSTPAFAYPNTTWFIDSRITGRIADLQIDKLQLQGLTDTRVDVQGSLTGLPDMNKLEANLDINNISSSKKDISLFIPKGKLPQNITLPDRFNTNGQLKTSNGKIAADLRVNSNLGNADIKGTFSKIADAAQATYDVAINSSNLNLGTIIQNKELSGPVSANFKVTGTGYDSKLAAVKADGVIRSAVIHRYNYSNVDVHAALADQKAIVKASMKDPNIHFAVDGMADLSTNYPSVKVAGIIDSIKFQQLHITKENILFHGKIDADFPVADPDNLEGKMLLTQALLVNENKRLQLDTVELIADRNNAGQYISLNSDIARVNLQGKYKLSQIPIVMQQAIQPYFAIQPAHTLVSTVPYDFTLNAYIKDHPALRSFIPGLERMDSAFLQSHFTDSAWTATLNAAVIDINGNNFRNISLTAGTGNNVLSVNGTVGQLKSGTAIQLNNTSVIASIANNKIDFDLTSKDLSNRDKYHIKGLLQQPQQGRYQLSVLPDNLLLNYQTWSVSANNRIDIGSDNLQATNFILSKNGQQLAINNLSSGINAPLQVDFTNFQLSTITGFLQSDSTFANGTINGKIVFTDIAKPLFTTDLTINEFSYMGDTVGNVRAIVSNKSVGIYNTDITLTGRGNDVKITGTYNTAGSNNFNLNLGINSLPMATVQAFSNNKLRNASGSVNGLFAVSGNFDRPVVKGDLKFNKATFNFRMLNSYFSIDQETLNIDEKGISFNRFEVKDSAGNALIVNGVAATSDFVNYNFDLGIRANNFQALNSTKKDNRLFYGQLFFNTNLKVKGTAVSPDVDGTLVINDKTKMTVVLPQQEPGYVEREGIVEFIDKDAPITDSLFLAAYDSLNNAGFTGMNIAVNITVVPAAEFNLIIDEGNGDFLNVKGDAAITAGVDPSGKIMLNGSYELEQGSYQLTFNFLQRKFAIEKGSRITWQGEPTDAILDVRAVYVANAAPLDLVKDQLGDVTSLQRNTYLQKLPFDVHLDMQGQLLQPQITFDIILPETKSYAVSGDIITNVRTRLDQLRQETGEMNKQVFSLLLLNRFIAENPFNTSGGSGTNVSSLARQSVSKLLTEQLNRLAADLIAGVDINFDVLASEDYTTGERQDRTDLNVGLSKRLLNDRLTVTIGSNFELEGPQNTGQQSSNIAGNLSLDYRISNDNRYVLRAYRKNEYQGIIEGYIIETGVGFVINLDYNKFRQIFLSKKDREERRLRRQKQREINAAQPSQTAVTDSIPKTN
jgi:translocation and assembly module TamB